MGKVGEEGKKKGRKVVKIITYGCAVNRSDSEILAGLLEKENYTVIFEGEKAKEEEKEDKADFVIINTCIVKHTTYNKVLARIKKEVEKRGKENVIVAGCLPSALPEIVEKIGCPYITVESLEDVLKILESGKRKRVENQRMEKVNLPRKRINKGIHIQQISSGCLGKCTFCITKFARGNLYSYDLNEIVEDVEKAIDQGIKEIWLTSQDNACYGFDKGTNLADLLKELTKIKGKFWIRVGMMSPGYLKPFLDDLIKAYESEKIYKFIHVPVQSGSERILKMMKRPHTVKDFVDVVNAFRRKFDKLSVWTDVIVAFPGETEKDFEETKKLMESVKPDFINVSRFSSHKKTEASKMLQLPSGVKKERSREMVALMRKISKEKNKEWLGWKGEVLITEYNEEKENWIGHNYAYKQIVIKGPREPNLIGEFVKVKIIDYGHAHLEGEIIR